MSFMQPQRQGSYPSLVEVLEEASQIIEETMQGTDDILEEIAIDHHVNDDVEFNEDGDESDNDGSETQEQRFPSPQSSMSWTPRSQGSTTARSPRRSGSSDEAGRKMDKQ